jgi:hypothetical protein
VSCATASNTDAANTKHDITMLWMYNFRIRLGDIR